MRVVMIGSGNVATSLSMIIFKAGPEIGQVLSRNENHARELAHVSQFQRGRFKSTPKSEPDQ